MRYIRTKDNYGDEEMIFDTADLIKTNSKLMPYNTDEGEGIMAEDIIKQADTIEELMMIGDLVFKKSGDIFVIANQAYIDYYIKHKSVATLFIKDNKGNYIRVAEVNEKGGLELL